MKPETHHPRPDQDKGSPALFYVILGTILFFFAVFLLLRPRGSEARPPRASAPSMVLPLCHFT